MADIRPDVARAAESDLGIHIGTVHIDLPAMRVNDLADSPHTRLKYAMGGWIGDHEGSQPVPVFGRLHLEICEIDVAIAVAGHRDDHHARHRCTGGVRAMSRNGN